MNKNDLRYIKTEKIIKESFKKSVKEQGFEKVTVSMICEDGMISRNAFYLHFTDKYDLMERLLDEFRVSLLKSYGKNITENVRKNDILESTKIYAEAILENKEDFLFLIKYSRKQIEKIVSEVITEMPIRNIIPDFDERKKDIKLNLNISYVFSAMVAYTELWFENYDKISKEEAVSELFELCETPTRIFFKKLGI